MSWRMFSLPVLFVFFLGTVPGAKAAPAVINDPLPVFYTIHEVIPFSAQGRFFDPQKLLEVVAGQIQTSLNLLQFDLNNQPFPEPRDPYDRKTHFGSWVRDPRDKTCYTTRAKVLIRDSVNGVVIFRPSNHCVVANGQWNEPYSGQPHTDASQMQIDHLVPLKDAYMKGAANWDWLHRCLYANYLGNPFHLVSADGPLNVQKGDRTPADWMPPNRVIACAYLVNWLQVKLIWGLVISPREAQGIQSLARQAGCNPSQFMIRATFPTEQRSVIAQNIGLCAHVPVGGGDYNPGEEP